jgi:hypothetical protein
MYLWTGLSSKTYAEDSIGYIVGTYTCCAWPGGTGSEYIVSHINFGVKKPSCGKSVGLVPFSAKYLKWRNNSGE